MAQEIELKLALDESAHQDLLRHPILRQAVSKRSFRLVNLYYDTPSLTLRKQGIGLRLRAQGKIWLQTVKCAGKSAGGLSSRPEWETPYHGHFDFSAIDDPAVRELLEQPKFKARITPIFETNFQRITWQLKFDKKTRIALMLDHGWIAAGGHRQAISEVEIELIEGDQAYIFDIALKLARSIALAPAPLSKADRGYRLFRQTAETPVKATPIEIAGEDEPLSTFRQIALSCLDHLQRNHAGAIGSDDPEYIHQMRVATRRLRAALRLFRPLLPTGFDAPLLAPLRELMTALGRARDYDVLLTEIAQPVLDALPDEPRLAALVGIITEQRFKMRQQALLLLASPHFGTIVLHALSSFHALKVGAGGTANEEEATTLTFAVARLRRLRKRVLILASQASIEDPPSLHALRIGIKRLRYALEFFAPLASPKMMQRMHAQLVSLQETLGQINDLANAGTLLMQCADDDLRLREAVTLIGGWHGPRHHKLLTAIPSNLKRLGRLHLPVLGT